jgi:cytochrome-b5 reductase
MSEPMLSRKMFDGIYIPAGLLVVGTVIVKREWTPWAVLLALILGAIKLYRIRKYTNLSLSGIKLF